MDCKTFSSDCQTQAVKPERDRQFYYLAEEIEKALAALHVRIGELGEVIGLCLTPENTNKDEGCGKPDVVRAPLVDWGEGRLASIYAAIQRIDGMIDRCTL